MLFLLVFYVFYEIRKKNIFLPNIVIGAQTMMLLTVAFGYSAAVRLMMIYMIDITPNCCRNGCFEPPMLLPMTIAVFIGVFIHMLFENKSITES